MRRFASLSEGDMQKIPPAMLLNNWFMLLAVHNRVMEHVGSLESTQEARVALGYCLKATLTLLSCFLNFPYAP